MLVELQAKNYGLIDSLSVEFEGGLNVLTGETGVGKSLLVSALKFLLGARADSAVIREGADDASVTGVFVASRKLRRYLEESMGEGCPELDGELILTRSIARKGRNRCTINDELVTTKRLAEVARRLVDIHGQHEEQSLLDAASQRVLLDRYAECEELRSRFRTCYLEWRDLGRRHRELIEGRERRAREIDLLRHQVNEIADASPEIGEYESLRHRQEMLSQISEILVAAGTAQHEIVEDDGAVVERIETIRRTLTPFCPLDPLLEASVSRLVEAEESLKEAVSDLSRFGFDQEYDPGALSESESRLDLLTDLRMKYGKDEAEVLDYAAAAERELAELSGEEDEAEVSGVALERAESECVRLGNQLRRAREAASSKLAKAVVRELKSLGMPKAVFQAAVQPVAELSSADETGLDKVVFGFCANPGESIRPLAKVASGGEVSRIFLAIKRTLVRADPVPLLIFDEIDANVGGRMGSVIGEKLRNLASHHQLICVTHLPQIASYASRHVRIFKQVLRGRTRTLAEVLRDDARLEEVAEMIRGSGVTSVTLEQAREMLAEASS